jgi:endonuclease-3
VWDTAAVKKEELAGMADMKAHIARIRDILVPLWPDARPLLSFSDCFELLCAVMMSAQTTDEQVNAVTPALFARYPDAAAMAAAEPEDIEPIIRSIGFFHTKARHLVQTARILASERGGEVPNTMEGLLELPGVGRKTANLVASACFGAPGIIVDTHVARSAVRLGLYPKKDPDAIEAVIRGNLAPEDHTAFSHALNRHGKFTCTARAPACTAGDRACPLEGLCPRKGVAPRR